MSIQRVFRPTDIGFVWTADGWYEWDSKAAHKQAMKDRNAEAAKLVKQGKRVKKWSSPGSLMSKGGIGSGKPHIELICTVYGFDAYDA